MRPLHSGVLLAVTLASSASIRAQTAKLTMSGIVTDKVSLKPVEAATVSVVGNLANQELTDGGGFFILSFSGSAHEGEAVRVHVEKTGYSVYDAWKSISSTIPLNISLEPITSRSRIKSVPKSKENPTSQTLEPTSPSKNHGTTDIVEAKPQYHGTTDEATAKPESTAKKGPRLGTGPDAYKELDDAQVGQWAIEEADKIEDMALTAVKPAFVSPEAAQWLFKTKFNDCCAQDVYELRAEILRRLGPPGKDSDEISAWTVLFPQLKYPGTPETVSPGTVRYYAPYLRRLGSRLKRRSVPRVAPIALEFSEQELPPEKPGYSHIVVTVATTREFTAGFIAVQFSGQPYSVGCDFQNSRLALTGEVPPDNPLVVDLLKATTNYVLEIGKTPFSPNNPVHVEARGSVPIHVSRVTFLDE